VSAGGMTRSLFADGFFFDPVRMIRYVGLLIGCKGTGDNHFSLISAFFAGTDLFKRFFWCCFGHFHSPLFNLSDGNSIARCQKVTLADFMQQLNMLFNQQQISPINRI
jgi:hypothetical protein